MNPGTIGWKSLLTERQFNFALYSRTISFCTNYSNNVLNSNLMFILMVLTTLNDSKNSNMCVSSVIKSFLPCTISDHEPYYAQARPNHEHNYTT